LPDFVPIPELEPVALEAVAIPAAGSKWTETYALQAVNENFNLAENFRSKNHDRRWNVNDALYFGYVQQRFWEGTQIARASIGIPITFDQIHAVKPLIYSSLFGTAGDYFTVEPLPGTDLNEALQVKARMTYALEHPYNDFGGNAVSSFKLSIDQSLRYGNGGVMLQYDPFAKMPCVEWVDLRDIYFDPAARTPDVESNRFIIYRKLYTIDELEELRGSPGMSIPSRLILHKMATERANTWGDMGRQSGEAKRGVSYSPAADSFLPSPADRFVEVLIYHSRSRIVWVLGRKWVGYNEKNPYGFLPFSFAPCYTVTGRFYAQSIADVQESNQRICEALMNGRLDEIALSLNPPRVRRRGTVLSPSQLRQRPGAILETDGDPDKDYFRQLPQQITANIYQEMGFFQQAARDRSGISAAMTSGMPMASNASRTNSGISMQTQGPMSRLSELIDNIENYLIVPVLYKMQKMMEYHEKSGSDGYEQSLPGYASQSDPQFGGQGGGYTNINSSSLSKACRFKIQAASKMLSREKLSGMLPFVMQTLLSGQIMAELHGEGNTVDFKELWRMFQDATGTANAYNFIRPMNQQEQAQLNAPPPQAQMQMQMKQMDQQTRLQIVDKKNQADLTKAALAHHSEADAKAEDSAVKILELLNTQKEAEQGLLTPPPAQFPA
jgi:hypothetical protein